MALLDVIQFDAQRDCLGFVGDLVNRGPDSLRTLRFIKNLPHSLVVLGNHDIHLLALSYGVTEYERHTLDEVLNAPDRDELIDWLRQQPLMCMIDNESMNDVTHTSVHAPSNTKYLRSNKLPPVVMVHAGIPPQWTLEDALHCANEVHTLLTSDACETCLNHIEGNQPQQWSPTLSGWDRVRYIVNAFTRLRFCDANGQLDFECKTTRCDRPGFKPWFEWPRADPAAPQATYPHNTDHTHNTHHDADHSDNTSNHSNNTYHNTEHSDNTHRVDIVYGHWAALTGICDIPGHYALDTGCVYGRALTALRLEDRQLFSVPTAPGDHLERIRQTSF